jgi:hypothetical protein
MNVTRDNSEKTMRRGVSRARFSYHHTLAAVLLPAVMAGASTTACVGGSKDEPTQDQTESLKAFILDKEPPDMGTKVGIVYDNKITLVGARVEPATPIRP